MARKRNSGPPRKTDKRKAKTRRRRSQASTGHGPNARWCPCPGRSRSRGPAPAPESTGREAGIASGPRPPGPGRSARSRSTTPPTTAAPSDQTPRNNNRTGRTTPAHGQHRSNQVERSDEDLEQDARGGLEAGPVDWQRPDRQESEIPEAIHGRVRAEHGRGRPIRAPTDSRANRARSRSRSWRRGHGPIADCPRSTSRRTAATMKAEGNEHQGATSGQESEPKTPAPRRRLAHRIERRQADCQSESQVHRVRFELARIIDQVVGKRKQAPARSEWAVAARVGVPAARTATPRPVRTGVGSAGRHSRGAQNGHQGPFHDQETERRQLITGQVCPRSPRPSSRPGCSTTTIRPSRTIVRLSTRGSGGKHRGPAPRSAGLFLSILQIRAKSLSSWRSK